MDGTRSKNKMPKILLFRQDGPEAPQLQKWLRLRLLSLQYRYGWDMNVNAYMGSEEVVTWEHGRRQIESLFWQPSTRKMIGKGKARYDPGKFQLKQAHYDQGRERMTRQRLVYIPKRRQSWD